jgi:hypothetical protein
MIDRNTAIAMLQALPDDKILRALQVASGQTMPDQGGMAGMAADPTAMGSDNKIQPWSAKEMTYGGGKDRPPLIDRMWAKPEMNAVEPTPAGVLDSDNGQYLQTGGM